MVEWEFETMDRQNLEGYSYPATGNSTFPLAEARIGGSFMVVRGHVHNGVVILADGVRLPEGQEVTVLAPPVLEPKAQSILEIQAVSLGGVVGPGTGDDDLLGEMLEGRS
jgi:hypothetical protein